MTLEEVKKCLEEIRQVSRDDEYAHILEDQLFVAVLTELAKENPIAAEALKSCEIKFSRWCA